MLKLKLKAGDLAKYIGHTKACKAQGCTSDFSHLHGKIGEIFEWVDDLMAVGVRIEGEKYWFMKEHLAFVESNLYKVGFEDGMKRAAELAEANICSCKDAHDGRCTSCGERIAEIIRKNIILEEGC